LDGRLDRDSRFQSRVTFFRALDDAGCTQELFPPFFLREKPRSVGLEGFLSWPHVGPSVLFFFFPPRFASFFHLFLNSLCCRLRSNLPVSFQPVLGWMSPPHYPPQHFFWSSPSGLSYFGDKGAFGSNTRTSKGRFVCRGRLPWS